VCGGWGVWLKWNGFRDKRLNKVIICIWWPSANAINICFLSLCFDFGASFLFLRGCALDGGSILWR
jgi:hypothetical protein